MKNYSSNSVARHSLNLRAYQPTAELKSRYMSDNPTIKVTINSAG